MKQNTCSLNFVWMTLIYVIKGYQWNCSGYQDCPHFIVLIYETKYNIHVLMSLYSMKIYTKVMPYILYFTTCRRSSISRFSYLRYHTVPEPSSGYMVHGYSSQYGLSPTVSWKPRAQTCLTTLYHHGSSSTRWCSGNAWGS